MVQTTYDDVCSVHASNARSLTKTHSNRHAKYPNNFFERPELNNDICMRNFFADDKDIPKSWSGWFQ